MSEIVLEMGEPTEILVSGWFMILKGEVILLENEIQQRYYLVSSSCIFKF